jgi:ABC-2 type transport system ATP-binding protein
VAVDNVSYTIQKGESFALLGPNGAGKTTIVRMLLDFIKPSSGSITSSKSFPFYSFNNNVNVGLF